VTVVRRNSACKPHWGLCVSAVELVEALGGLSTARGGDRQHRLQINPFWNLKGSSRSQWAHREPVNPLRALWALEVPEASDLQATEPRLWGAELSPGYATKSRVRTQV